VVPWQDHPDLSAIGLTEHDVATAAYWIDVDGRAHRGADGIARLLVACGGGWSLVGWFLLIPPIAWAASGLYRLVARYRHRLPGGTPACQLSR
jgi:predicted DCC family thiol-disulfide oxidoreductase YuxK